MWKLRKAFMGLRPYNGGLCSPHSQLQPPQRRSVSRKPAWGPAPHSAAAPAAFPPHTSLSRNNPARGICRWRRKGSKALQRVSAWA